MNKITGLLPAVLFCLPVFFASCTPDDDPCDGHPSKTETYYVSAQTKSKSPYKGYEVIIFTSDKGDTATLIGQGPTIRFNSKSEYSTGNPDCGNMDYWNVQILEVKYVGVNVLFNQFKSLQIGGQYVITKSDEDYLGMDIFTPENTISITTLAKQVYDPPARYTDSIEIGSRKLKAIKFYNGIFYNEKYGVVRFTDTLSEKIWTIKLP